MRAALACFGKNDLILFVIRAINATSLSFLIGKLCQLDWHMHTHIDWWTCYIILNRAVKGCHILVSSDGRVCLTGLRYCIPMWNEEHRRSAVHSFPDHAVAILPWIAPEVLDQVTHPIPVLSVVYMCNFHDKFPCSCGWIFDQFCKELIPYL